MRHWPFRLCSIVLIIVMVWEVGCTVRKVKKVDPSTVNPANETIVGITTKTGQDISFDPPGGSVRDNSVRARVRGADYVLPLSEV